MVISRTAVRANVPQERASQINSALVKMIQMENSIDAVSVHLQTSVNIYQKEIQSAAQVPEAAEIRLMKEFMQKHFQDHLTLEEIAVRAGYADAGYFAKVFRKTEQMTPSQYRQTNKNVSVI